MDLLEILLMKNDLFANRQHRITTQRDTHLMAIFQDNRGKLVTERHHSGFYRSKDDGGGSSNWSYETYKAAVKSLPSNH